jgi:predicted small lipoprotein YifL
MNDKRLVTVVLLAMILAGCGGSGPATQPPDDDQLPGEPAATSAVEPPPADVTPLEWLAQVPFEAGMEGQPDILPAELPEGFNAFEPEHGSAETPDGFTVYRSYVTFERPIGNQVNTEDQVTLELSSYSLPEGRTYHFERITEQDYAWEFVELDGYRITRYHSSSVDGRVWISGPYLVVIYSGLDTSPEAPWVEAFARLFLVMFPPG